MRVQSCRSGSLGSLVQSVRSNGGTTTAPSHLVMSSALGGGAVDEVREDRGEAAADAERVPDVREGHGAAIGEVLLRVGEVLDGSCGSAPPTRASTGTGLGAVNARRVWLSTRFAVLRDERRAPRGLPSADSLELVDRVVAPVAGIPPVFRNLVFVEILVFIAILAAAFAYAWRKGVFEWR